MIQDGLILLTRNRILVFILVAHPLQEEVVLQDEAPLVVENAVVL